MGNDVNNSQNDFEEVKTSLQNYINIPKCDLNYINQRERKIHSSDLKFSNLSKKLRNTELIDLTFELLIKSNGNLISKSSNIDITKSVLNSDIYLENSKENFKQTSEQIYYTEQIRLIDELNEGNFLKISENKIDEKENKEENFSKKETKQTNYDDEITDILPSKSIKKNEKDISSIKLKNEEFLRKLTTKRNGKEGIKNKNDIELITSTQSNSKINNNTVFDDLSIEEYLKKEANRIKSIYGTALLNDTKTVKEEGMEFDMRKNKNLQSSLKEGKNIAPVSKLDNSFQKSVHNLNDKSSNSKSLLNTSKQINIKIDLSKFIPPEEANKSFTNIKSLSPGVRVNYKKKSSEDKKIVKIPNYNYNETSNNKIRNITVSKEKLKSNTNNKIKINQDNHEKKKLIIRND